MWDRKLLHHVLETWRDPLGIVDLRKLMTQTFEGLEGLLEGTLPYCEGG